MHKQLLNLSAKKLMVTTRTSHFLLLLSYTLLSFPTFIAGDSALGDHDNMQSLQDVQSAREHTEPENWKVSHLDYIFLWLELGILSKTRWDNQQGVILADPDSHTVSQELLVLNSHPIQLEVLQITLVHSLRSGWKKASPTCTH